MTAFGYAGKILRVDLSSGRVAVTPTSDYAEKFLGGRGIAAKIYWDETPPEVSSLNPETRLIFATGPLGGVPAVGGSRWAVCGKSATKSTFSYCNMGGRWGAELKFAGYDAVVIHGQSEKPVYLFIDGETPRIEDASAVWGKGSIETRETLKTIHGKLARVVAIGPAAENQVVMASFFADNDASGSGQIAASMGAKNLKAIVVCGGGRKVEIARPDEFREFVDRYRELKLAFPTYDWYQISRWSRDLVLDFKTIPDREMKREPCYGCMALCARQSYHAANGTRGKFLCHSAYFYQPEAERYYGKWNDVPFHATKLCDQYGVDTKAIDKIINLLDMCWQQGILTDEQIGLPLSKIGSMEFIEHLVRKVALRQGVGEILAQGAEEAKKSLLPEGTNLRGPGLLAEPGFFDPYGPRYIIMNAFPYAMEPTFPIGQLHEAGMIAARWRTTVLGMSYLTSDMVRRIAEKFWGSEQAADFTTYEGKALAAKLMQDRQYAKESLILCDFIWPMTQFEFTEDHIGDPNMESRLLSAVVGKDIDEPGLRRMGERIFNLQRAIMVREGHRGRDFDTLDERCFTEPLEYDLSNPDCVVPGPDGEPVSVKGRVVDRDQWEKMKGEYYTLRGWDPASGFQTRESLENLDLKEVADDLQRRGLLTR